MGDKFNIEHPPIATHPYANKPFIDQIHRSTADVCPYGIIEIIRSKVIEIC